MKLISSAYRMGLDISDMVLGKSLTYKKKRGTKYGSLRDSNCNRFPFRLIFI
jgi:hypothetical protein